jgi:hypothetical protein
MPAWNRIRPGFGIAGLDANGLRARESEVSRQLKAPMQSSSVCDSEAPIVISIGTRRSRTDDEQPGSYQLACRVSTDKKNALLVQVL